MDFLKDFVIQMLMANGLNIALGVAAVAALGAVLGLLKKLAAALFRAAVNAGDSAAAQLAAKPKAPLLALLAAALAIPAVWAGYHFSHEKVVEKFPPPPPPEFPPASVAALAARIAALEAEVRRNKEEQARQAGAMQQASARQASAKPPRPVAKPGQPVTHRELHAWAIKALEWDRYIKVRYDPLFLDPPERQKRIDFCWEKECGRRRKEALAAQAKEAEKWRLAQAKPAPVPPVMTPGQLWELKLSMQGRCRAQALADLQKAQHQYRNAPGPTALIGGLDYERRWR